MFVMSCSPEKAPDKPVYIEVSFEKGIPVAVNDRKMSPAVLLQYMNEAGGANGIGRVDMVENRYVGMKSRGVYETPGGTILREAHIAMESITLDREVQHLKNSLALKYAELVYNGYWFSPEMNILRNTVNETQEKVSGTVRLKLYKGNCIVTGRKSAFSLYSEDFATFEKDSVYDQKDAGGFIKINGLRMRIKKILDGKKYGKK